MLIRMCRGVQARTLTQLALKHIEPGSRVDTDSWHGYEWLKQLYDHHTVKHSERYVAEDGAHCNTAEAEWSIFKPWWRTFRGVAKKNVHLYLAQYEFKRNRRELSPWERLRQLIGFCYAYWSMRFQQVVDACKKLSMGLFQFAASPALQPF